MPGCRKPVRLRKTACRKYIGILSAIASRLWPAVLKAVDHWFAGGLQKQTQNKRPYGLRYSRTCGFFFFVRTILKTAANLFLGSCNQLKMVGQTFESGVENALVLG